METKLLNTGFSNFLKQATQVFDAQHRAIAINVSNVNNKEFKRINTDFSEQLETAVKNSGVKVSRDKHIQHSRFDTAQVAGDNGKAEGPVDLAREMTDLSVNQIRYELATRALARHYSGLTTAIIGRNR